MRTAHWRIACILAVMCTIGVSALPAYGARNALPVEVRDAVRKTFPKASITSYGRETENGVRFYEVNLRQDGLRMEVEVDKYGGIGEIERRISFDEAPNELVKALAKVTGNPRKTRIERHERWGVARNGKFVKLETPRVFYEMKLTIRGKRREVKWTPQICRTLPSKVANAIKEAFPRAVIVEAEKERENGIDLYEVALIQDGRDMEVEVSAEGVVIEIETEVAMKDVPSPVAKTIIEISKGARVKEVEKVELRAVVKSGKLVKLREPTTFFEVEVVKGDKQAEIKVSPDGTMLEPVTWEDEDDDEDDGDDGDREVSIDQVPEAVRRTILREAGRHKVEEIEEETRNGVTVYQAEWTVAGKEVEIKVAADGKLLEKEVDDDEDDD